MFSFFKHKKISETYAGIKIPYINITVNTGNRQTDTIIYNTLLVYFRDLICMLEHNPIVLSEHADRIQTFFHSIGFNAMILDEKYLKIYKVKKFANILSQTECVICLTDDVKLNADLLQCGHMICATCRNAWVLKNKKCPECSTEIDLYDTKSRIH
jgi:hypothetical protein